MKKVIDLELAREFLGEPLPELSDVEKKKSQIEKKKLKELREKHSIEISISFEWPWWDSSHREAS